MQQAIFTYIMQQSSDENITSSEANQIFSLVQSPEFQTECQQREKLLAGIAFYSKIHQNINECTDMIKLRDTVKYFFVDNANSEHMQNEYNVVQALMKICIHRIWQLCYNLHPRLRTAPRQAIDDIIDPTHSAQVILVELMKSIKEQRIN